MSLIGCYNVVATILDTASLSDAIELDGNSVVRILMPAAWDAANLTFQVSDDGGTTFVNAYWDWGAELTVTAAASRVIETSPFVCLDHIDQLKVRAGTAGVPVVQSGDRLITFVVGPKK